jgi:hypothetical protein
VIPPFKLTDTSTIYVELESNRYCPEGVQLSLTLSPNLEIIIHPHSWVGEVNEGDVYQDSLRIIPTTTELAFLSLMIEGNSPSEKVLDKDRGIARATFDLHFSFDSTGKVDYLGRKDKYYRPSGKLPWEVAASLGEEYRVPKGAIKKLLSEPLISIRRKR